MNASQNFHRVKKIRVERYIESVGSITLEIICGSIHDSEKGHESKMEITLFDLPMAQRLQLWNSFKDGKSHWICDDENEDQESAVTLEDIAERGRKCAESNPIAIAAAKELSKDFDHIGG